MKKDYAVSALAYQKQIRIYAGISTQMVNEAFRIHETFPTASAALGRLLTVSSLFSLMSDESDHLTLRIEGDGPLRGMLVEAKNGIVKGDVNNPYVYLKYEDGPKAGHLNVGAAVGAGYLHVTKKLTGTTDFFTSSIALVSGEIGDDFTYYFAKSEQTPSSVGLGVLVNPDYTIGAAGGYILQVLPGCSNEVLDSIESVLSGMTSITDLLKTGKSPEDIIALLANGTQEIMGRHEIKYECDCSKENFEKSLSTLNREMLETLAREDHGAEITCHFCKKTYHFTELDLLKLVERKQKEENLF